MKTKILILAAGVSRRMNGADKLLQLVDGTPLLRAQALKCTLTGLEVIVALPPQPHPRFDVIHDLDVTAIAIPDSAEGMSGTLRKSISILRKTAGRILLLLADLPEITLADIETVLQSPLRYPNAVIWRGATADGKPGHPILFDASVFDDFETLSGDSGGQAVIRKAGENVALVPLPDNHARCDLDTPEDWADWRARTGR
ncbi:nucleotidyltransferase family protein [Parasulfitobacter algicola]|uniref:Nucleotidyltransferase family protein n=1 Tax=Parasulfitobacter algicola TaxID=2614809 RepID=A0ABX2IYN5_9RHOB|nr:nucleotidyltransferase family protein [Sulfitobacter algicola]NSX56425.1 nucleotidyltransferase family protein [Sulfitobacter algicola]